MEQPGQDDILVARVPFKKFVLVRRFQKDQKLDLTEQGNAKAP
jgi:hypothetical protein